MLLLYFNIIKIGADVIFIQETKMETLTNRTIRSVCVCWGGEGVRLLSGTGQCRTNTYSLG